MNLQQEDLDEFIKHLYEEERALATVQKYEKDISDFIHWLGEAELSKISVIEYKAFLCARYKPASVNSKLAALNSCFSFLNLHQLRVKKIRLQKQMFCDTGRELIKEEYRRLLRAARDKGNERLYWVLQTICGCGIRISELNYITVEAIHKGKTVVSCKGKTRTILLPRDLCTGLKRYCAGKKIEQGSVFVTKSGKPLNRSNIWSDMKKLCADAQVEAHKVFPHNLRHLFARTYYALEKDLNRLADILGHASVETTRIYTMTTSQNEERRINRLNLVSA